MKGIGMKRNRLAVVAAVAIMSALSAACSSASLSSAGPNQKTTIPVNAGPTRASAQFYAEVDGTRNYVRGVSWYWNETDTTHYLGYAQVELIFQAASGQQWVYYSYRVPGLANHAGNSYLARNWPRTVGMGDGSNWLLINRAFPISSAGATQLHAQLWMQDPSDATKRSKIASLAFHIATLR
ncbi:MAG: hypothetical protein J2P28_06000 [Actinobacteria bacterium]|nr:hypothetical protein [Actinomycetota bacterium]